MILNKTKIVHSHDMFDNLSIVVRLEGEEEPLHFEHSSKSSQMRASVVAFLSFKLGSSRFPAFHQTILRLCHFPFGPYIGLGDGIC